MSKCHSCLKEVRESDTYCLTCRKRLFSGALIKNLSFTKPEYRDIERDSADRISISGVQNKISLKLENGELKPTDANGEYILKPAISDGSAEEYIDMPSNEHISMLISKNIFKIDTADCCLIPFRDGELAYLTKRFDNYMGKKVEQEDLASVFDMSEDRNGKNYKYELSYHECGDVIKRHVPVKVIALEELYKRVLLNYLICNGDMHLKNISIYRKNAKEMFLTPNYDVLNTRLHILKESGDTALELFKDYESKSYSLQGFYMAEDFEDLANAFEIKRRRLSKILRDVYKSRDNVIEYIDKSFLSKKGKESYTKLFLDRFEKRVFRKLDVIERKMIFEDF